MASLLPAMLLLVLALYLFSPSVLAQILLFPIPRPCKSLTGGAGQPNNRPIKRNEYPSGGILMALAQVSGGTRGVFEFYLCLEDGNNQDEECLNRKPLQLADGSGTKFDMSKIQTSGNYQIPIIVPDKVSCEKCTLQWRVIVEECPEDKNCQVMDEEFCSDISIKKIQGTVGKIRIRKINPIVKRLAAKVAGKLLDRIG